MSLTQLRERLADQVVAANEIRSDRVAAALRDVPRHLFLPHLPPETAYRDDAIVTKRNAEGMPVSSSSQPAIMAIMLDQLGLAPGQRVLEVGAGTGYNAALIRHIVGPSGTVVSVDIDCDLTDAAREHLASAGYFDITVVCADGAAGWPAHAPYDRVIATVGVSDLAPAWLDQAGSSGPDARIVVPLDVRGMQLSVAFEETAGHWASRSLAPCGFMRMRGSLAGAERIIMVPEPGLVVTLPDGSAPDVDGATLAAALAGPPVRLPTGVRAVSARAFWGLGLWLAAGEPRSCKVDEERPPGSRTAGAAARLGRTPLRSLAVLSTVGIADPGGIAVLTVAPPQAADVLTLEVSGFGPHASGLAADLAAHVRAWDQAGQPGTAGLRVEAYPRSSPAPPGQRLAVGALLVERPCTRFVVYHA